jgi:hypothetical protein
MSILNLFPIPPAVANYRRSAMDLVTACRTRRLLGALAVAQDARGVCRLPHTPLALPTQIFGGIQVIPAWRRQVLAGIFSLWVNRLSSDRWPASISCIADRFCAQTAGPDCLRTGPSNGRGQRSRRSKVGAI